MDKPVFSIVFDKRQADRELTPLSTDRMILALLARQPPEASWNGCLVYEGETPSDPSTTKCVGITGPSANRVQERLVETMESLNIPVLAVYDGGPEVRHAIARVSNGTWSEP